MNELAAYYTIVIEDTGETFRCSSQQSVLTGMERLGRHGISIGCRQGGCGVCKVQVIEGTYERRVMSRAFISTEDEAAGRVLACRIRPTSDMRVRLLGKTVPAEVPQEVHPSKHVYHTITIEETGETFPCSSAQSILAGMERLGKRGVPVGCRGGGCGVCKIEIISGTYVSGVMSRTFVSLADEAAGRVLACRVRPTSDIRLRVLGQMAKTLCRPP